MALKDLWTDNPDEVRARRVQQLIAWAGDGALRDGTNTANEFREFLELIPGDLLTDYCQQCLDEAFDNSGLALQDLVNQIGKRLGFDVEYGRYRGSQSAVSFDGLWTFPSGHKAIVEVKTTSAYQLRLDTIARYRTRLIEQSKITNDTSSVLIVVGRDDTGDLEAQIRGSRYAWDIRLIGIDSLIRLMHVKEELEDPSIVRKIHEILIPREFTKLDAIIELLFSTASDLRPEIDVSASGSAAVTDVESSQAPATFSRASYDLLQKHFKTTLVKQTRSSVSSADGHIVVVCKASRVYDDRGTYAYWFGFYDFQMEMITAANQGFAAFQCGTPDNLLLLPAGELLGWSELMNTTDTSKRSYWHVHISSDLQLIRKAGAPIIDLRPFVLR